MGEMLSSGLGTVFYSIVVFMAGALIGRPMWCWMCKSMPWSDCGKDCSK